MELKKPPIITDNLGENYIRHISRHSRRLLIISSVLGSIFALGVSYFVLKIDAIASALMFIVFLTTLVITGLFLQYYLKRKLLIIIDALYPLSQAHKTSKIAAFREIENTITQGIYRLKSKQSLETTSQNLNTDILECANFGLLSFDAQGRMNYCNFFAQKLHTPKGQLTLDFGEEINLQQWILQAQSTKLKDQRTWYNLSFFNPETQKYSWYNIVANFHKSNHYETVVLITETPEPTKYQEEFDFITYAAHELRGPITIIRGYLDILKTDFPNKTEMGQIIIERLTVAGNRLSSYVNNILNVARLDQKNFSINPRPVDPNFIINEIYDDINLRARTNQKTLVIDIEPNLPEVSLDTSTITQALTNLVDNAIKYSKDSDSITVKVFQKDNDLLFQVIDHGIGMSSAVLNNLFKRFYRSHRTQNQASGTGIGLFITKAIINAHNGTITVNSEYQKGSTFTITLPIDTRRPKPQSKNFIKNHGLLKR